MARKGGNSLSTRLIKLKASSKAHWWIHWTLALCDQHWKHSCLEFRLMCQSHYIISLRKDEFKQNQFKWFPYIVKKNNYPCFIPFVP